MLVDKGSNVLLNKKHLLLNFILVRMSVVEYQNKVSADIKQTVY